MKEMFKSYGLGFIVGFIVSHALFSFLSIYTNTRLFGDENVEHGYIVYKNRVYTVAPTTIIDKNGKTLNLEEILR